MLGSPNHISWVLLVLMPQILLLLTQNFIVADQVWSSETCSTPFRVPPWHRRFAVSNTILGPEWFWIPGPPNTESNTWTFPDLPHYPVESTTLWLILIYSSFWSWWSGEPPVFSAWWLLEHQVSSGSPLIPIRCVIRSVVRISQVRCWSKRAKGFLVLKGSYKIGGSEVSHLLKFGFDASFERFDPYKNRFCMTL